jgi:acyl transferase domain-containing protein
MLAVESPPEVTMAVLGEASGLSIAAYNGPAAIVLSGRAGDLDRAGTLLAERGIRATRVNVDYASHSPYMDRLRPELLAQLHDLAPRRATGRMISTVRVADVEGTECGSGYWAENLRAPVHFAQAVARVLDEGDAVFIELSPHPVLLRPIEEAVAARASQSATLPSCRRDRDERACLLAALAALYERGARVNWTTTSPGPAVIPLSAADDRALAELAAAYATALRQGDVSVDSLAYNAAIGRDHLSRRAAVVGRHPAETIEALEAIARDQAHPMAARQSARPGADLCVVLVLSGDSRHSVTRCGPAKERGSRTAAGPLTS